MAEDHYSTASDYIQALIRQDVAKKAATKQLEALLEQGMESGIAEASGEELFRALRAHLSAS
jgi:Arc/MetJ-type ribon-helix-helix transcriptional regulator